jgi:hypothetical protein
MTLLKQWNADSVVILKPANMAKCPMAINDTSALDADKPFLRVLTPFTTIGISAQNKFNKSYKPIAKAAVCEASAELQD